MKRLCLILLGLAFLNVPEVLAQSPPGQIYGRCSQVYGPVYSSSKQAYTAKGSCSDQSPVRCKTDPLDGTMVKMYYCQANGNNTQDPNAGVAADKACGCVND